jgi:hypothetical protein
MIKIEKQREKTMDFYKGVVTMVISGIENSEWNFMLIRSINGETKDEIEADMKQIEAIYEYELSDDADQSDRDKARREIAEIADSIEETVLANIKKEQITWI